MVRRGEYLERAVVIPSDDAPLDGLYHRGARRPGVLIVPPHPSEGSMSHPIVAELAWAVTRAGYPTLRFDHRGVGASRGSFSEETAAEDARTAAAHLRACCAPGGGLCPLAVVSVGRGAEVAGALARSDPHVAPLFLVSPPPDSLLGLEDLDSEVVVLVAQALPAPVRDALSAAVKALPRGRLVSIPGADPSFLRGLVQLGRFVAETLAPPGEFDFQDTAGDP